MTATQRQILICRERDKLAPMRPWLKDLGWRGLACPLMQRHVFGQRELIKNLPTIRPSCDAVLFTSASSPTIIQKLFLKLPSKLTASLDFTTPCFCVGAKTAAAAKAAGFQQIITNPAPSPIGLTSLSALLENHQLFGHSKPAIIHCGGTELAGNPKAFCENLGWHYDHWPLYDMRPKEIFPAPATNAWLANQIDAVLLFSPRQAEIFSRLTADFPLPASLGVIGCLSKKVADGLASRYKPLVAVTQDASEAAWQALLRISFVAM